MKYLFLISSFFIITNGVAMNMDIDWTNEYKKHAQIWYKGFPEKEQEMLRDGYIQLLKPLIKTGKKIRFLTRLC